MDDKDRQISRRGFFSSLLRDAAKLAGAIDKETGAKNEFDSIMADFESLPIASTYPWELFEDEAKRLGIDYEKIGKVEAIKRIIAYQMKQNPPDAQRDTVQPQFDSSVHLDPITDIYAVFDAVFRVVIPSESARKLFAIKGISEKISGNLGWYLWFEDKPGAYLLELVEAEAQKSENGCSACNLLSGRFQIKYYPDTSGELLETFSFSEQVARTSRLFDATGTPIFDADSEMNGSLFGVGRLDVLRSLNGEFVEFMLSAPERWTTYHLKGLKMKDQKGRKTEVLGPGERDRDVPAWELSWWLLDRLISAFSYAKRTGPMAVALFEKAGNVFEIEGTNVVAKESKGTIRELRLAAAFTVREQAEEKEPFDLDGYIASLGARESLKGAGLMDVQAGPVAQDRQWINSRWWHLGQEEILREDTTPC